MVFRWYMGTLSNVCTIIEITVNFRRFARNQGHIRLNTTKSWNTWDCKKNLCEPRFRGSASGFPWPIDLGISIPRRKDEESLTKSYKHQQRHRLLCQVNLYSQNKNKNLPPSSSIMNEQETKNLNDLVARVKKAQLAYSTFTQEQVDRIFRAAALAAADARIPLAQMAAEESGMGVVEDKVIKNHFSSEYIFTKYKDEKTCGVLEEDEEYGIMVIAEPIGIICGVVPCTNPTSTTIFKALISLKTRNGIIFSPHPRTKASTCHAAKIVLDAAIEAGAPPDIIGFVEEPTLPVSNALMRHPDIDLILATGGPAMVKSAYSSGKPAIGKCPRPPQSHRRARYHTDPSLLIIIPYLTHSPSFRSRSWECTRHHR